MNSENEFLNKKVIVTGASSGIGQSVAYYFLNCGAQVVLAGNDVDTMTQFCKKYDFKNATIMKLDLINDMHIYDFKTSVVERLQSIDIIINCAGIKFDGDIEKTYPQDFDYTIDLNLRAVFIIIRAMSKFLSPKATIINISCLYGTRPCCGMISYAMSKAGLETLTKYAAADFASLGVRVNAVTACPVDTNILRRVGVSENENDYFKKKMEKDIPMGRIARPDDIVKVVVFLASERSSKITGQIIRVDGGRGLTSSGYIHYKGKDNMNERFEPDGYKFTTWVGNMFNTNNKMEKPITDPDKLKKFIKETISQSNFSTRITDAHLNVNPNYKTVDANEDLLKQKYLGGVSPNSLLEKRQREQGSIYYGEGQYPIQQIPENRSSALLNSQDASALKQLAIKEGISSVDGGQQQYQNNNYYQEG